MVADLGSPATIGRRVERRVPQTRRAGLLAAVADPSNWRKPADVRPAMRDAARDLKPVRFRLWTLWLIDRLDARGELHRRITYAKLVAWSGISRATFYRYLAALEDAGIIEREGTARKIRGEWRRETAIRAGAAFREPETILSQVTDPPARRKPLTSDNVNSETFPTYRGRSTGGSVGNLTTGSEREPAISAEDRDAVDNGWPRCARSITDLPGARPGYGENLTRERAASAREFDREYAALPYCPACDHRHPEDGGCYGGPRGPSGADRARAALKAALTRDR